MTISSVPPASRTPLTPSLIRTWAPIIAGMIVAMPLAHPIIDAFGLDTPTAGRVTTVILTGILSALYYLAARLIERRWPAFGVLLGLPVQPQYQPAAPATAAGDQPTPERGGHVTTGRGKTLAGDTRITVQVSTRDGVSRDLTFAPNMLVGHAAESAATQLGEDHTGVTFRLGPAVCDRDQTLAKAGIHDGSMVRLHPRSHPRSRP